MTASTAQATMHIGELAEKTGLSLRTIRHYDDVGVLKASGRTEGGFRIYTQDDLTRLLLIRRMKPLGFTLEEMSELLTVIDQLQSGDPGSDSVEVRASLGHFIDETIARREGLHQQLAMADEFVELLRAQ